MLKALLRASVVVACTASFSIPLVAQEVIHALTGTVSSINSAAKTITVFQDNGSKGVFDQLSDTKRRLVFDKKVANGTTAANEFNKPGSYAIVFYFGSVEKPTVVALKPLGTGPFASTDGTVTKFERGRSITVTDSTGAVHNFKIDSRTVAEGNFGVVEGAKFQVQKGDRVRIVSENGDTMPVALFLKDV